MLQGDVIVFSSSRSRHNKRKKRQSREKTQQNCTRNRSVLSVETAESNVEKTRLRAGMASRQGGSFNSILTRRKSPPASLSSEQQSARRKNLRGKKYTIRNVSELTFLVLVRPTAPGCLFLWGTLLCVGGRPPSLSFFAISSVRSSRPRPSRTATALLLSQTTTKHGPEKRGRASRPTLPSANRSAAFALRSIPSFF